jgi:uncharacterized damage-inducible protein DinB
MKLNVMFSHWEQVHRDLLWTIDQFNDEELDFVPFEGSWSVKQIILHIADCEDNWLHGVVQGIYQPWIGYPADEYPTRQSMLDLLASAHDKTVELLSGLDESDLNTEFKIPSGHPFKLGWIIWHVLEHEIHHRGELSLILGLLGREGLDV